MIIIINYGVGNTGSINNMLKKVGVDAAVSSDIDTISKADKLILPGVGAFDNAMLKLDEQKFIPVLNELVVDKHIPILGICLGMQILGKSSEEGKLAGLGWIDAHTVKFKFTEKKEKIPHMGWNVFKVEHYNPLLEGLEENSKFYYVHSYHLVCSDAKDVITKTFYGYDFVSAVNRDNIYGVQFHPEKSHKFGLKLLENFSKI